jgi:hypothetical protein
MEAFMARTLFWLSDEEWDRIQPYLPRGRRGAHRVDDRRVISGIIHMLKCGARWRDCPPAYGPYTTIYNRFNRWSKQGVWLWLAGEVVLIDLDAMQQHRSGKGYARAWRRDRARLLRNWPADSVLHDWLNRQLPAA